MCISIFFKYSRIVFFVIIMEEFYRRKYLSPTYSRPTYNDTLEKDKTVAELRKQLLECKEMEQKFDDLCLQIVKLERENKKIQSQQSRIQGQYLEKIKKNKVKITQLKQQILDSRQTIESKIKKTSIIEAQNEKLASELERIRKQSEKITKEKAQMLTKIADQESLIEKINDKFAEIKQATIQTKKQNQLKSEQLQKNYQQLKVKQLKLKQDELKCQEARRQFQQLHYKRQELEKKIQVNGACILSAKAEHELKQKECAKSKQTYQEMQKESQRQGEESLKTKELTKKTALENKQNVENVKKGQKILIDSLYNLQKDQVYLQKMSVKEVQLKKNNERLEDTLKQLNQMLAEEQESYNRIIGHMKFSIQEDQKAIECLSKQANLLENMIN